nr:S4 domain-containing protein [Parabacteroides goldsteinii]
MEIRLNKLLSDAGYCSRREADKFIEMGRVTVNGKQPEVGQKVSKSDIVMLDDIQINVGKYESQTQEHSRAVVGKTQNLVFGETTKAPEKKEKKTVAAPKAENSNKPSGSGSTLRPGKYVKYNKYAAARKAAKSGTKPKEKLSPEEKALKDALQPKFGKSLGKAAVAQRLAASPKSASLRKTSKNNPLNKAKRTASRNKPKDE